MNIDNQKLNEDDLESSRLGDYRYIKIYVVCHCQIFDSSKVSNHTVRLLFWRRLFARFADAEGEGFKRYTAFDFEEKKDIVLKYLLIVCVH